MPISCPVRRSAASRIQSKSTTTISTVVPNVQKPCDGWPKKVGYPICDTPLNEYIEDDSEKTNRVYVQCKWEGEQVEPDLYTYCSPPTAVKMTDISGIQRRANYRNNVPKPRGVHSYYNLMWDGRVRRGDPNKKRNDAEECEKIRNRLNQPRKSKTFSQLKAEAKEKSLNAARQSGNADNETKEQVTTEEVVTASVTQQELLRFSQLAISNLCPKDPEKYLQDLHDEIDTEDPCYKGRRLQTLRNFPIAPSKKPNLQDAGTQIFPGEFFDFEVESADIIEKLVGSVVEQARLEILEEEEAAAHKLQQELFEQRKVKNVQKIENMKGREGKVEAEKRRLEKLEKASHVGMTAAQRMYKTCAVGNLTKAEVDECVKNLKKEERERDRMKEIQETGVMAWLNQEVKDKVKQMNISRNFLDSLIIDVVSKREAEYADAIWREVYQNDPLNKYGNHDGFVPPTPETSLAEDKSEDEDLLGDSDLNDESDEL